MVVHWCLVDGGVGSAVYFVLVSVILFCTRITTLNLVELFLISRILSVRQ